MHLLSLLLLICFYLKNDANCAPVLVDMSYNYDKDTLFWPTNKKFEVTKRTAGINEKLGIWISSGEFCSGEHAGTHMDAPIHFGTKDSWTIADIPLSHLSGPAVVVDISAKAEENIDAALEVSDLEQWENEYGRIPDGSIVLLYSGWGKRWPNTTAFFGNDQADTQNFHFPGFNEESAKWLLTRNIIGVGVDGPSLDRGQSTKPAEAHQVFNKAQVFGLEYVANIQLIPKKGAILTAMPMKIKDGSGAPTRVFAVYNGSSVVSLLWPTFLLMALCHGILKAF